MTVDVEAMCSVGIHSPLLSCCLNGISGSDSMLLLLFWALSWSCMCFWAYSRRPAPNRGSMLVWQRHEEEITYVQGIGIE